MLGLTDTSVHVGNVGSVHVSSCLRRKCTCKLLLTEM